MKRILSLLLSVMLVLSAFPGVVFAAETAAVTVADAKGAVGETISLQVKLNTSIPVDSIALRNLVYNNEVLEFVGFDDYSALEDNFAFDATVEKDLTYISIALKEKVKFDATNENLCTLKFKVLKEEEASVSLTAIVKDDKVELVSTVVPGKVNELEKIASVTVADGTAKVGETLTLPVKLNTTTAVDSIALRDFSYDAEILEFTGFADYSALENLKALDFTMQNDPIYASFALKEATVFDSSNENIVSLEFKALKAGNATVSFNAVVKNDAEVIDAVVDAGDVVVSDPTVEVTSVEFDVTEKELTEGDSFTLNATVLPGDATVKTLTWDSDAKAVATVDQTGKVTAIGAGTAKITATSTNGKSAECTVTVIAKPVPKSATFTLADADVKVGDTVTIPVKLNTTTAVDSIALRNFEYNKDVLKFTGFADYSALEALKALDFTFETDPAYASFGLSTPVVFDSSNENIVSLTFEAIKEGTSQVYFTAVVKNDAELIDTVVNDAEVTVEKAAPTVIPVTSVTINKESAELTEGDKIMLEATVEPDDATDKTVTWSSDKESVATVVNGEVTAVAPGTATITAKAGDCEDTCVITVVAKPVIIPNEASFVIEGGNVKAGENIKVPVKLTTSKEVDSIAIRSLVYESEVLEFVGFADYEELSNNSAWDVTVENDKEFLSTALSAARKFDGEKIVAIEFKALKEGTSDVSFTAVVKNDTVDFDEDVNTASVTVEPKPVTGTAAFALSNEQIRVGETAKVKVELNTTAAVDSITIKNLDYDETEVEFIGFGDYNGLDNWTITPGTETVTLTAPLNTAKKFVFEKILTLEFKALKKGLALINFDAVVKNGTSEFKVTDNADGSINVLPAIVRVTEVIIENKPAKVTEGESFTLTATVKPDDATDKTVTWKSSDEAFAKVDKDGNVTTFKAGKATITVETVDGGFKAECVVTVEPRVINVTGVNLDKTSNEVTEGDVFKLTATVTPDNASNKEVTWSSSDEAVAKVDKDGNVTTFKAGKATITVETVDGGFKAECEVTVKAKAISVTDVTLDEAAKTLTVGEEFTLTATVAPDNADIKTVTWSSSDETVAKVEDGKVTALKAGEATITVKTVDGGFTAECVVTVNAKALTGSVELTIVDDAIVCSDAFGEAVKGEDYEIKWFRNGEEITVEDGKYNITEEDYGATFSVKATANGTTYTGEFTDELVVPAKAPSDVKISTSKTEDSITAIFTAKANGSAITKFVVTITDNEAYSDAVEVTENDGKFRYTFENLETGVEYTITAKAVNGVGESEIATAKATPKKKTSSGGGTYPQIIRPANGTTPPAEDPVHRVEIDEDKKASIPGEDLKNKEKVEITFNDIPELPETKVEADIKDKDIANMEVIVEPTEDGDIKVEVVAKDSKGNEVELPVDIKIVSTEDKDAVIVDENGEEKALVTIYDAENGILEIKDVVSGNIKFAKEAKDWFDDDNGRWSESEINKAATRGLVNGKAPRIFEPTGNLTRHESNKLQMNLVNALDENLERTVFAKFDTPADHWAYASDDWAVSTGIMKGVGVLEDGTFVLNGEANITRQEFMTVIYRMMKAVLGDFEHDTVMADFVDSAEVADYAKDAVSFLSALNIVKGCEDCEELKINPTASITREEATAIINRVFDVVAALK